MSFSVVSTFSGCGGSSLGYALAGGKMLLACEWEKNAAATYSFNFPSTPLIHGDIVKLSCDEALSRIGMSPGELDVLDGSPPCQGFSTAGSRRIDDKRNQLFREYVRLLRGLMPRAFVMENVSGMVKGAMRLVFADCLRELKTSGYRVRARLLNAKYYNVPQSRPRLIFVGLRSDLGVEPSHPKPQTAPITLRRALEGLQSVGDVGRPPKSALQFYDATRPGTTHAKRFSFYRCAWDRTPPTVCKVLGTGGHWHPDEKRYLSVNELKRVCSYPDDFQFCGRYADAVARMGNSVPPNFMRAIATHVAALLEQSNPDQCPIRTQPTT